MHTIHGYTTYQVGKRAMLRTACGAACLVAGLPLLDAAIANAFFGPQLRKAKTDLYHKDIPPVALVDSWIVATNLCSSVFAIAVLWAAPYSALPCCFALPFIAVDYWQAAALGAKHEAMAAQRKLHNEQQVLEPPPHQQITKLPPQ